MHQTWLSMSAAAGKRAQQKPTKKSMAESSPQPQSDRLWVNWDFLRSLTKRPPRIITDDETQTKYNRYLKLADIALGPTERRKSDQRKKTA